MSRRMARSPPRPSPPAEGREGDYLEAVTATVGNRGTRPPLERMLRIHQAIASGRYPNASSLATDIEVVTKTIHRDVEFMRDRLGLPIAYDARRFGYYYSEEVSA